MPQQDTEHLQAVNQFLALDFTRKEGLQEIVELASTLCSDFIVSRIAEDQKRTCLMTRQVLF